MENFPAKSPSSVGTWIKCFLLKISLGHSICLPPTLSWSACWWSSQENSCRMTAYYRVRAARKVGINIGPENEKVWVFSPNSMVSTGGRLLDADISPVMWLERPLNTTNILINSSLSCSIETPLDDGEAFRNLCYEIQCFMPENFLPTLASMSACVMAASYQQVIASCGFIGVPLLYGVPGSCKLEALKCGLALFGAQKSHLFNSQTTSSFLFQALTQTTIPIGIDDISEKAQETWEEMVIDLYNNTPCGTRSYHADWKN